MPNAKTRFVIPLATLALLTACSVGVAQPPSQPTSQPTSQIAAPTAGEPLGLINSRIAFVPTAEATSAATPVADMIMIWWPASLFPETDTEAGQMLRDQVEGFKAAHGTTIALREKRDEGRGGIFETLRSGSVAAPAIMPDLALVRRADLVQAVSGKLIEPIDLAALGVDDLFQSGLALGRVNNIQYGIPYTLQVQHSVYRTQSLSVPPRTLDELLQTGQPYLFPAGAVKGVNSTLLAQYLAAGGHLADDKGNPVLDLAPLQSVLVLYEQAVNSKQVGPQLLDYTSASQYLSLLTSGKAGIAQIDSTSYLAGRSNFAGIAPSTVLSSAGLSQVDGWLWVVTTTNPDRQGRALDVLRWFLQTDQQSHFTQLLGVLPSRRTALAAWNKNNKDAYTEFVRPLLDQAAVPPPDMIDPALATALQKSFEDVLSGRKSAEAAANDAVDQVSQAR